MSACGCEHCTCDCEDCCPPRELTPEEVEAERQREEARQQWLWTPARNAVAQLERSIYFAEQTLGNAIAAAMYATDSHPKAVRGEGATYAPVDAAFVAGLGAALGKGGA